MRQKSSQMCAPNYVQNKYNFIEKKTKTNILMQNQF